jgi:hypothetical protein
MPMAKPVPTALWPVPMPAYADGDVPTAFLAVPTATPCLRPVVNSQLAEN